MMAAVGRGEISQERLDRSVRRVLELKRQLGLFEQRKVTLEDIPAVVGRAEFQAEAREMATRVDRHGEGRGRNGARAQERPSPAHPGDLC